MLFFKLTWESFRFAISALKTNLTRTILSLLGVTINTTVKAGSNAYQGMSLTGVVYSYQDVYEISLEEGRYFTQSEINASRNMAIIGRKIASTLYPNQEILGKEIKIKGGKFTVIGVFEEEGEGLFDMGSKDEMVLSLPLPSKEWKKT